MRLIQNRNAEFVPASVSEAVSRAFSKELLAYNSNWEELDSMLDSFFSSSFRESFRDSHGTPWVTSWFVLSQEFFATNPRAKTYGPGEVHSRYHRRLAAFSHWGDEIQYHFHPSSIGGNPVAVGTSFNNSVARLVEDLAVRLFRFNWFPSSYRPGFHSLRPDSHLWVEQWFPFDFGNQSYDAAEDQPDLADGRAGDWRRAPKSWRGYRPSLTDYQVPGELNRTIFRCLNMGTRLRTMRQEDVSQAFAEADEHGTAVLAFTNHDFRDIRPDIVLMTRFLENARAKFPGVSIRFASASDAARIHLGLPPQTPKLFARWNNPRLEVSVDLQEMHSHQPFLAIRTRSGKFLTDNFDRGRTPGDFRYTFDDQTLPIDEVREIGVAVVGKNGKVATKTGALWAFG